MPGHQTYPAPAFKRAFLGRDSPSNNNFSRCAISSKLGSPILFALRIDLVCSSQALLLGTAQPSCAMLQCKPEPALQKAPAPHQLIPQPRPVQTAWAPHWRGAEMEMGDSTGLFQTPLWLTGSCYLTSPATAHSRQLSRLAPLLSFRVSPQEDGDTGDLHHSRATILLWLPLQICPEVPEGSISSAPVFLRAWQWAGVQPWTATQD